MEALKWKLPAYKHPADSPAFHSIKFYWTVKIEKGDKFVKISICKRVEAVNIAREALQLVRRRTSKRWCKANVHWSFVDNECCRLLKMQLKVNSMLSRWLFAALLPSLMHCCEHNERLIKFMNAAVVGSCKWVQWIWIEIFSTFTQLNKTVIKSCAATTI